MVAASSNWNQPRSERGSAAPAERIASRTPHVPTHDEIQRRAFEIYERSGRQAGNCEENWMQAERELTRQSHTDEQNTGLLGQGGRIPAEEL